MRFKEIDLLRGLAVIGMVFYHFLVDLEMFYQIRIGVFDYPVVILARIVGFIFIFLLGFSAQLQYFQTKSFIPLLKRSLVLFFWALIISLITYLLFPTQYIRFGILHFLGSSLLLLIPLLKITSNIFLSLIGFLIIIIGIIFPISSPPALDFYPILPWFGFVIFGLVSARNYSLRPLSLLSFTGLSLISTLGRKSLFVYLIHQPILMALLYLAHQLILRFV